MWDLPLIVFMRCKFVGDPPHKTRRSKLVGWKGGLVLDVTIPSSLGLRGTWSPDLGTRWACILEIAGVGAHR